MSNVSQQAALVATQATKLFRMTHDDATPSRAASIFGVMADPAERRADLDDLLAVPAHRVAEILDGERLTSPRLSAVHARAASNLGGELYALFDRGRGGRGGWIPHDGHDRPMALASRGAESASLQTPRLTTMGKLCQAALVIMSLPLPIDPIYVSGDAYSIVMPEVVV